MTRGTVVRALLVIAAVVAAIAGRAVVEGRAALHRARDHFARDEIDPAIAYAMRATKWYVPLASHPAEGYDLLRAAARKAEAAGDTDTALIAWQAIRGGARATRSLYQPYEDRAREADTQIAVLLAARAAPGIDRDKPREKVVQEHRALLAEPTGPKPLAVLSLYTGLALLLVATYRALAAVDASASANVTMRATLRRRTRASIAIAAVGLLVFVLAVVRA